MFALMLSVKSPFAVVSTIWFIFEVVVVDGYNTLTIWFSGLQCTVQYCL